MNTLEILNAIEQKTKHLKQQNERLLENNSALEARVAGYVQQIEQSKAEIKQLKEAMHVQALGQQVSNNQALRKELERYIKIIDQCMAALATQEG
ncbi:MAG: hypothetical protein FGM54_01955 [Chitinophagaceae bacterium]|nr:hypothetical protein [Chitinophagaceae bacterium]